MKKSRAQSVKNAVVTKSTQVMMTPAVSVPDKRHNVTLYVAAGRQPLIDKLDDIATKLDGTRTQLLWHLIENAVATGGPKEIKVSGTVRSGVGSAPGFWMTYELAEDGSLKGVSVKEVKARSAATGDSFFRYKRGDKKERDRMLLNVKRAADFEAKKAKISKINVTELTDADLQEVLMPAPAKTESGNK